MTKKQIHNGIVVSYNRGELKMSYVDLFTETLENIRQNHNVQFQFQGTAMPDAVSTYFRSKQEELYQQYSTARLFLRQADQGTAEISWDGWFNRFEDITNQNIATWLFREKMYQAALMFYNVVIDLSWVLCYTSAEYAVYSNGQVTPLNKLVSIEEAYGALRTEEESVIAPNARNNPFDYLNRMTPTFSPAIEIIKNFWDQYSASDIRHDYNFIKHRGKPNFTEVNQAIGNPRLLSFVVGNITCPTDVRDVQKEMSLEKGIQELIEFDNKILYPYISKLIEILEKIVCPSPFVT